MTTKERLRRLRTECRDWDEVIFGFVLLSGMRKRDAELAILNLEDVGLVRIEPNPNGLTAFVLTLPDGIPEKVLAHAEE